MKGSGKRKETLMQKQAWHYHTMSLPSNDSHPIQPESQSPHTGPQNQHALPSPTPASDLMPFLPHPLTTSLSLKCTSQLYSQALALAAASGEILFFHLPSRPVLLTALRFCSNVIFSAMPTLIFLLKIVACPHCR